ncbi:MAG: helix-turn-helix domain-containing protein [Pseudomonadota bacterium]
MQTQQTTDIEPIYKAEAFPEARVSYGRHPGRDRKNSVPTVSASNSIDITFFAHTSVIARASKSIEQRRHYRAGTGGIHGSEPVTYFGTDGPSEYIEIQPTEELINQIQNESGCQPMRELPSLDDPVHWSVSTLFRAHMLGGIWLDPLSAETCVQVLLAHVAYTKLEGVRRLNDERLSHHHLVALNEYTRANISTWPRLSELAALCHRSPFHFSRSFKRTTGVSPSQFVRMMKMERARTSLESGLSVQETAKGVGYRSGHSFRSAFARQFGSLPSKL